MTGSHSVSGVSIRVQVAAGASARIGLTVAAGESFIGTVAVEVSRTGGATWETARTPAGTLLSYTGTIAAALTGVIASESVANESFTPVVYRIRASDVDSTSNAVAYAIDTSVPVDGLGTLKVARATFDPSAIAAHRTVAAHGLGVTIPSGSVIVGGFVDVLTTCADGASDAGTIAIKVEGANDIVSAIAISNGGNPWDAGRQAIVPKADTPESTSVKATADREITATVAVHALTVGKLVVSLFYV